MVGPPRETDVLWNTLRKAWKQVGKGEGKVQRRLRDFERTKCREGKR